MSGGYFDYDQYRLESMASEIDELIASNDSQDPNGRGYPVDIIEKFNETRKALRLAAAMTQRVDWLVSCDDGVESFRSRWAETVTPLNKSLNWPKLVDDYWKAQQDYDNDVGDHVATLDKYVKAKNALLMAGIEDE